MMKSRKIAIIGLGSVGKNCAYALILKGLVDVLLLVDTNQAKVQAECQDLRDAMSYCPYSVSIHVADYGELGDCDIIVNSVGNMALLLETMDRLDELNFNIAQVNDFVPKIMAGGFNGIFINISNPCDIITSQVARLSGLPKGHVFGTGTGLDTSRLIALLSKQTGIAHRSISACMMGEHGSSIMVPWSQVSFYSKPLSELETSDERFRFDHKAFRKQAEENAYLVLQGKHCTEYGICTTLARVAELVLHDEKAIMPASTELNGEYGVSGIFAGVPCIIGSNGIEEIIEYNLPEAELEEFRQCCDNIRHNMTMNDTVIMK
jgi:L-lactate dehydrogenase